LPGPTLGQQRAAAAGGADDEAALDEFGNDQHRAGFRHQPQHVGVFLATQHFAAGLQALIDQRLALGVGARGRCGEKGRGERGGGARENGSAIELHTLLLGWQPAPDEGNGALVAALSDYITLRGGNAAGL
jgi:hypothetical protein